MLKKGMGLRISVLDESCCQNRAGSGEQVRPNECDDRRRTRVRHSDSGLRPEMRGDQGGKVVGLEFFCLHPVLWRAVEFEPVSGSVETDVMTVFVRDHKHLGRTRKASCVF